MEAALAEEEHGKRGVLSLIGEMLRKPFLRATVFVVGLGFFVQITGINAIVYYSPRIFEAMGFQGNFALLGLPALVQVAGLAAVFVSLILVDRMGRRPILLTGIGIMILANALLVAVFSIGLEFGGALTALGFLGLVLFTVGFTLAVSVHWVWVYAGRASRPGLRSLGLERHADQTWSPTLRWLRSSSRCSPGSVVPVRSSSSVYWPWRRLPSSSSSLLKPRAGTWRRSGTTGRTVASGRPRMLPRPRNSLTRPLPALPLTDRRRLTKGNTMQIVGIDIGGSKTHAVSRTQNGTVEVFAGAKSSSVGEVEAGRQLDAIFTQPRCARSDRRYAPVLRGSTPRVRGAAAAADRSPRPRRRGPGRP